MADKGKTSKGKAGKSARSTATKGVSGMAATGKVSSGVADNGIVDRAVADKDKIDAIVSPRIDDPTANIVAGARIRQCAQCGTDVFVAPSTFAYFKGKPMPPIWCVPCAMLAAETHAKSPRIGRA
jgi:hypothetical protein